MKLKKFLSLALVLSLGVFLSLGLASCDEGESTTTTTHTHSFTGEYKSDSTGHWQLCSCGEKGSVLAHTFGEYTIVKEATEDSAGSKTRTCSVCNYTETETIAKLDHTHSYGEWSVTTAPTETTTGELSRTCSKDSTHTETAEFPVLTDTSYVVTTTKAATCTEKGTKTYTLSKDGQELIVAKAEIAALGHTYREWSVTTAPTESTTGLLTRTCSVCNETETAELPILNETNYSLVVVESTYEAKGSKTYKYTKDDQEIDVVVIEIDKLLYKLPAGITSESFDKASEVYYFVGATNIEYSNSKPWQKNDNYTTKVATAYYNGKFYDSLSGAVSAARLTNEDNAIIYMKPNATSSPSDYSGAVMTNLTIYGNGATVVGADRLSIEEGSNENYSYSFTKDITINLYDLNNACVWGTRYTTYTLNINAVNTEFARIYINGSDSYVCDVNINLSNCKFIGEVQNETLDNTAYFQTTLYSNCNGKITLDGCEFKNLAVGLNLNHKMAGSQVVTITNTTFIDVAVSKVSTLNEEAYFAPVRMYQKVDGATATLTLSNCTFTYSEGKSALNEYILLNKIHKTKEAKGTITYNIDNSTSSILVGVNVTKKAEE